MVQDEGFAQRADEGFRAVLAEIETARPHKTLAVSDSTGRFFKALCVLPECDWTGTYVSDKETASAAGLWHERDCDDGEKVHNG